jgi:UDP-N-acetylmuramoyl-tripeptide--D-alanyl-D-alanine ligase
MEIKQLYALYSLHYLVDTDTRNIRKNTLFFALQGPSFNGNKFADKALELGAAYAIIDQKEFSKKIGTILVESVLETLQALAKFHRLKLKTTILCLTGSNGKTTTKELINAVLAKKYNTTATKGNLNNHIGVPLTMLSMTPETAIGIVEIGANHQKEIAFLCSIAQPDYGYITNFGKAHLEGFEGIEGVIKGKSELYTFLYEKNKTVFVNPKDPLQIAKTTRIKTIQFPDNIQFIKTNPFLTVSYQGMDIQSNLVGDYNYTNIAAAITIGSYFKIEPLKIKRAIESYAPNNNRSQIINTQKNQIFLDAYNANPSSMEVSIINFSRLPSDAKTIILGDMFELGVASDTEHQAIIDLTDGFQFENTLYVGEHFYKSLTKNKQFKTFEALKDYLKNNKIKNQIILIKGSRGMRLERVIDFIN